MLVHLPRIAEVIFARVAPGVLNLVSIVLLGRYLEGPTYGIFSTTLATTALVSLLMTGPVRFSILPHIAIYEAQGKGRDFEKGTLSLLLLTSTCLGCLGALLWLTGVIPFAWAALAIASALFEGWTPVLRARLQFWRYGFAAWTKAITTILMVYFLVIENPTALSAIWAYALGSAIGFLTGWIACGAPFPKWVERVDLKAMVGLGCSFTLSDFAESGLFLGTRYIILWLGSAEFLGLFTFAIDLAQRSVGVVINILSFAIVPRAYKISANEGSKELMSYLKKAGLTGAVMAAAVFIPIILLGSFGWLEKLLGSPLSLLAFTSVSAAVTTNLLKKMVIDPIAVGLNAYLAIPTAYILVAPLSMGLSAWFAYQGHEGVITYIFPASYLCVACLTTYLVYFRSRFPK